ncbi:MAG TPA: FG-GAP-like repeat-containing protein, partial [Kofleriaceae bacterium]
MRRFIGWLIASTIAFPLTPAAAGPTPDGNFIHSIPIPLPRGPGASTPRLALAYQSSNPDGWAGRGFTIEGLPAITRMNHAQPIRYDATDELVGPHGRLFAVGNGAYHGANEDFAVYRPSGSCAGGPCSWTMQDRQGNTWFFGTTESSRIEAVARGGAVRVWALARFQDTHGNAYEVTYDEDAAGGDYYPSLVRWSINGGIGRTRTATFRWEPRADHRAVYDQGARVDMDRRLREIEVASNGSLVRKMTLGYDAYGRLTTLDETGSDNTSTLPRQTFTWSDNQPFRFGPGMMTTTPGSASQWPAIDEPEDDVLPGDYDGDGLLDLFNRRGSTLYLRHARQIASGGATWDLVVDSMISGRWGERALTTVGDFNGDGRSDVISLKPCSDVCTIGGIGYTPAMLYYGRAGALLSQVREVMYSSTSTWNRQGFFWAADFDGDGRDDLATRSSSGITVALSTGDGFARPLTWTGPPDWGVPEATYVVDYDGDGRADLLTTRGRDIYVMRSTGIGFTVLHLYWPVNATNLSSSRMWVGDFNGDGKTDITAAQGVGGGWSKLFLCSSTGSQSENFDCSETLTTEPFGTKNFAADFDADGRTDLLSVGIPLGWTADGFTATAVMRTAGPIGFSARFHSLISIVHDQTSLTMVGDADGNGQPDLVQANPGGNGSVHVTFFATRLQRVIGIGNGLGGDLGLTWTPQRQHANAINYAPVCGGTSTVPDCGIPDRSGRPLLTRIVSDSGEQQQATRYGYASSRIVAGPPGRGAYLGFKSVHAEDEATQIHTSDIYRQAKPFAGVLEQHRVYVIGGGIDTTTLSIVEVHNDPPAQFVCTEAGCTASSSPDPDAPRQLRPALARTQKFELGRMLYEVTSVPSYDAYGNAIAVTTWASDADGAPLYEERSLTSFINVTDPANRAIGVPYEGKVCVDPTCVEPSKWTRTYFDDLPLGTLGTRHRVTRIETWAGGSTFAPTSYGYDSWGNLVRETSPDAQTRTFDYDTGFRSERIAEHDPVNGTTWLDPDDRWNIARTATHESGRQLAFELDAFGRPWRQTTLHVTGIGPGIPYRYREYAMPTGPGAQNRTRRCDYFDGDGDAATAFDADLCTSTWVDGFGRTLVTETDAAGGAARVVIGYDSAGREQSVSEPHHAGDPIYATVKDYDVIGRPSTQQRADGTIERIRYNSVPLAPGAVTVDESTDGRGLTSQRHRDVRGRIVRVVEGIATTCIPLPDVPPCCISMTGGSPDGGGGGKGGAPNDPPPDTLDPYPKEPPPMKCFTSGGIITDYVWDPYGRLVAIQGPDGITTTITYDAAGRRETFTHPSSGTTTWTYYTTPGSPEYGKVQTETRANPNATGSVVSTYHYDVSGRLQLREDSDGTRVDFTYDETDVANGRGRLTTARSMAGGFVVIERFGYDLEGNNTSSSRRIETDAGELLAEGTTQVAFDALGRAISTVYPDGTVLEHRYDVDSGHLDALAIGGTTYARFRNWDPRGKLGAIELANGVNTRFEYTAEVGSLQTLVTTSGSQTLLSNKYAFDANGNLTRFDDGVQSDLGTTYHYDALDRLRRAQRDDGKIFDYLFSDGGRMAVFSELDDSGNVVTRTRGIDPNTGRLTNDGVLALAYGAGGALVSRGTRGYQYDDHARLTAITEADTVVQRNVYDHLHQRVLRIEQPEPNVEIRTYVLGELYEVTERHQKGELVERRGTRLVRGPDGGRLVSLTADLPTTGAATPAGFAMTRRPLDPRTVRIAIGGLTLIAALVLMLGALRRPRRRWYRFVAPVVAFAVFNASACSGPRIRASSIALTGGSQTEPVAELYYSGDHVGSAAVVTDKDGNEVVRLAYAPFGGTDPLHSGVLGASGIDPSPATPPVGFTGARLDRDVDLYEMGHRYYDPTLGELITPDTLLAAPDSTQGLSLYQYANNNPITYSDPSGHVAWFVPLLLGFAAGAIYGGTDGFSHTPWSSF